MPTLLTHVTVAIGWRTVATVRTASATLADGRFYIVARLAGVSFVNLVRFVPARWARYAPVIKVRFVQALFHPAAAKADDDIGFQPVRNDVDNIQEPNAIADLDCHVIRGP